MSNDPQKNLNIKLQQLVTKFTPELNLASEQLDKLCQFALLIEKWNKTYNLTAIKSADEMLTRHIVDSLLAAPFLHSKDILDFGTGGGLPGIPLAILFPNRHFTLLDSNNKKIKFIQHVAITLQLTNVTAIWLRIENFNPSTKFSTIITRATTSLVNFITLTQHLLATNGQWLALKGPDPSQEIEELKQNISNLQIENHALPALTSQHHNCLIRITYKHDITN